jgi:hypothetical protein
VVNNENSKVWQHRTIRDSVAQTLKCRSGENICRGLLKSFHSAEPQFDDSESEVASAPPRAPNRFVDQCKIITGILKYILIFHKFDLNEMRLTKILTSQEEEFCKG